MHRQTSARTSFVPSQSLASSGRAPRCLPTPDTPEGCCGTIGAFLPRAAIGTDERRVNRHIQIGVSGNDQRVFGAHLELALHEIRSSRSRNLLANQERARE